MDNSPLPLPWGCIAGVFLKNSNIRGRVRWAGGLGSLHSTDSEGLTFCPDVPPVGTHTPAGTLF